MVPGQHPAILPLRRATSKNEKLDLSGSIEAGGVSQTFEQHFENRSAAVAFCGRKGPAIPGSRGEAAVSTLGFRRAKWVHGCPRRTEAVSVTGVPPGGAYVLALPRWGPINRVRPFLVTLWERGASP